MKNEYANRIDSLYNNAIEVRSDIGNYYDFCRLNPDGTFSFGCEYGREGGTTLSPFFCPAADNKPDAEAAEIYRRCVISELECIKKNNPPFYASISSLMTNAHTAFLSGAPFQYTASEWEAEQERICDLHLQDRIRRQKEADAAARPQAVYNYRTKQFAKKYQK